jgi:hypothetical protein
MHRKERNHSTVVIDQRLHINRRHRRPRVTRQTVRPEAGA